MADPISIASFAASAALKSFKAVRALALFKSQVSGIDQTVESLHYQVDGVSVVLSALSDELNEPEFTSQTASLNQSLIRHLPRAIEQCDTTLTSVNERINKLNPPKKRNIAKQTWTAVKLQWSEPEISDLLGRVKGHSMNLQLALMTVSLHNSVHKKAVPSSEQTERFDKLEQMLIAIQDRLDQPTAIHSGVGQALINIPVDECTTALLESATSVVSSASTAAGRSTSGITTYPLDIAAFDYICEDTPTPQPAEESTTGSELGPPRVSENIDQLNSWIHQTSLTHPGLQDTTLDQRSGTAIDAFRNLNDSGVVLSTESQSQDQILSAASSDDEDDVDFVVATKLFREAKRYTEANNPEPANLAFKDAFKLTKNFNTRKCQKLDLHGMKILFAYCKFDLEEDGEAENLLSEVACLHVDTVTPAATVLKAQYGLAVLKFKKGELQYAETLCRQVLKHTAKLPTMGKSHTLYLDSLGVLSMITLAKGEPHQAKHYVELLPGSARLDGIADLNYCGTDSELRQLYSAMVISLSEFHQPYFQLNPSEFEEESESPEGIERHIYVERPAHSISVNTISGFDNKPLNSKLRALLPAKDTQLDVNPLEQRADPAPIRTRVPDPSGESKGQQSPLLVLQEKRRNFIRPSSRLFESFVNVHTPNPSQWYNVLELEVARYEQSNCVDVRKIYKLGLPQRKGKIFLRIHLLPTTGKTFQWRSKQCKDPFEYKFSLYPERLLDDVDRGKHGQTSEEAWESNGFTLSYDGTCKVKKGSALQMQLNDVNLDAIEVIVKPHDRIWADTGYGINFSLSVKAAQLQLAGDSKRGYRIQQIRTMPSGDFSGPEGQIVLNVPTPAQESQRVL